MRPIHQHLFPSPDALKQPVVEQQRFRAEPADASWGDKAVAFLRERGPARSDEICKAIGLESESGIAPFIRARLKHGQIVRDGRRYALAGDPKLSNSGKSA
jgi:hypothetical protein